MVFATHVEMTPDLKFRCYGTFIRTRIEQAQKKVGSELQNSINATAHMTMSQPPKVRIDADV